MTQFMFCKTEKWHNNFILVVQTPLSQATLGTLFSLVSVAVGGAQWSDLCGGCLGGDCLQWMEEDPYGESLLLQ